MNTSKASSSVDVEAATDDNASKALKQLFLQINRNFYVTDFVSIASVYVIQSRSAPKITPFLKFKRSYFEIVGHFELMLSTRAQNPSIMCSKVEISNKFVAVVNSVKLICLLIVS